MNGVVCVMQKEEVEIYENIGWVGMSMSICNDCKECIKQIQIRVNPSVREVRRPNEKFSQT